METRKSFWSRKWWIALALVAIAGYTLGKDRALRDNAADRAVAIPR